MSTLEHTFNREMEFATYMKRVEAPVYWQGYAAGLMRAVFGTTAVDDHRHESWLQADTLGEAERGYRDGFRKLASSATGTQQAPFRCIGPGPAGSLMTSTGRVPLARPEGQRTHGPPSQISRRMT